MGFFGGLRDLTKDLTDKVTRETRETYRTFRDGIEFELNIDSSKRWDKEYKADIRRKEREAANDQLRIEGYMRESAKELGLKPDPVVSHGKPICVLEQPENGAIIYCKLGPVEHSGVYIGNKEVIQLNSKGIIEKVSLERFTDSLLTLNPIIWVPMNDADDKHIYNYAYNSIGSIEAAHRARKMINKQRDYNLIMDNCHQFSAGCLIDNFENANNFLVFLKDEVQKHMNDGKPVKWHRWNWVAGVLVE
ncbi:MAG: hypothetical protein K0R55_447 [Sporomusa sp.]|jgi:hypothetical protein|nr:hypothetical protein [Sporomusa sp.]